MDNILDLINILHNNGFYHGDCQLNNIMVYSRPVTVAKDEDDLYDQRNYRYYLIDFGNADYIKNMGNNRHDIEDYKQLMGSLGALGTEKGIDFSPEIRRVEDTIQRSYAPPI